MTTKSTINWPPTGTNLKYGILNYFSVKFRADQKATLRFRRSGESYMYQGARRLNASLAKREEVADISDAWRITTY